MNNVCQPEDCMGWGADIWEEYSVKKIHPRLNQRNLSRVSMLHECDNQD